MTAAQLQQQLANLGVYRGAIDGQFGQASKSALIAALALGPDSQLCPQDIARGAQELGCDEAAVKAVWSVEAQGCGFENHLPKILPEPHRFSMNTAGRWDRLRPDLSWPVWKPGCYPASQALRYAQLAEMVSLDVDAGLKSCSYGAFQILGENAQACGYPTPWAMAYGLSLTEGQQLDAFICFVRSRRLDAALRTHDWATFAAGYNGSAFRSNQYDTRLAAAYRTAQP